MDLVVTSLHPGHGGVIGDMKAVDASLLLVSMLLLPSPVIGDGEFVVVVIVVVSAGAVSGQGQQFDGHKKARLATDINVINQNSTVCIHSSA